MVQRSGIDTIKYHTWPRIPMGKWQTHRRHHKREPRGQPFHSLVFFLLDNWLCCLLCEFMTKEKGLIIIIIITVYILFSLLPHNIHVVLLVYRKGRFTKAKSIDITTCLFHNKSREGSGSVIECLTRDRGAAGSSLTGVTALCPWARKLILA